MILSYYHESTRVIASRLTSSTNNYQKVSLMLSKHDLLIQMRFFCECFLPSVSNESQNLGHA